jgi:hypothetical protein
MAKPYYRAPHKVLGIGHNLFLFFLIAEIQTARLLKKRKHHFVWNRRRKITEIFLLSAFH